MMFLRPTLGGLLFIIAAAVSVGVALMNVALITALIASILCSFLLVSLLASLLSAVGYKVERDLAGEGRILEEFTLPLRVTNRLILFRQNCVIREKLPFLREKWTVFEVPCLRPGESMTLERKVRAEKRGHFHLQKLYLVSGDPAGLFAVQRSFSLPGEVLIEPRCEMPGSSVPSCGSSPSFSCEGRPTSRSGLGNDFFGVRPYHTGDEMRHIHWRISAAKGELMVREFEALATDRVTLVLDTDQRLTGMDDLENNFEKLVSLAWSMTSYLSKHSCMLTFLVRFNEQGVIRISGEASSVRGRIREILTELGNSPGSVEDLVTEQLDLFPEGTWVCILSMDNSKALHRAVTLLEEQKCEVAIFYAPKACFPYLPDDEPFAFVQEEPVSYPDSAVRCLITCQTSFDELRIFHDET